MKNLRRHAIPLAALVLMIGMTVVVAPGCTAKAGDTTASVNAPNAPRPVTSAPSGTPAPTDAIRLADGPAPLGYMLGTGGNVRVVDLDTGKTVAKAAAPLQAIIVVDQSKGVSVANTIITPGPLPAGHRYELWLDRK